MKIGFLIFRLANLKGLGRLITLSSQRGHDVTIFVDPTSKAKLGEEVNPQSIAAIWPEAEVRELDTDANPQGLAESCCDAIIGMDILEAGEYRNKLDAARENGAHLFSVSYLYEATVREPSYMASLDKAFYLSEHQRSFHESLFQQSFDSLGSDWKQQYTKIVGLTCCDQLADVDAIQTRKRYGIPESTPVVLFMSLKMAVPDIWRAIVWGEGGKVRRTLKALTGRHWRIVPDIWTQNSYREICQELKHFCIRNGALLVVKSRIKNKVILPVHLYGHPVDIDPILEVAGEFGITVVEDAAESLGATYKGRPVGSLGDMACFSFNGNKIITTGGGGMITTDSEEWAGRAKFLTNQAKDDPFEYVHNEIGYNYRMTNIEAALGVAQLEQLDTFIQRKMEIIDRYREVLRGIKGVTLFEHAEWAECTYWLVNVLVDEIEFGSSARELMAHLQEKGIQSRPLWRPIHLQGPYISARRLGGDVSETLYRNGLSLPCSVGIQDADLARIGDVIRGFARA